MRFLVLLCLFLGLVTSVAGDSFEDANRLYEKGDYAGATVEYRQMLDKGQASPALYFNLGNALFRSGDFGLGIWCYRQAYRLAPRDPDIRANLQFSRKEVAGAFAPEGKGWKPIFHLLAVSEWNWVLAIALGILFALLAFREHLRTRAGVLLWPIRIFGVMAPALLVLCCVGHLAWHADDEAVVVAEKLDARYGPLEDSKTAFSLLDGEEVTITGTKADWVQIVNTSGQSGWVIADTLQRIGDILRIEENVDE